MDRSALSTADCDHQKSPGEKPDQTESRWTDISMDERENMIAKMPTSTSGETQYRDGGGSADADSNCGNSSIPIPLQNELEHSHNDTDFSALQESVLTSSAAILPQLVVNTASAHQLATNLSKVAQDSLHYRPPKKTVKKLKRRVDLIVEKAEMGLRSYKTMEGQLEEMKNQLPTLAQLDSKIMELTECLKTMKEDVEAIKGALPKDDDVSKRSHENKKLTMSDSKPNRAWKPVSSRPIDLSNYETGAASSSSRGETSAKKRKGQPSTKKPEPETNTRGASKFQKKTKPLKDNSTKTRRSSERAKKNKRSKDDEVDSLEDFIVKKPKIKIVATKHAPRTKEHLSILGKIESKKGIQSSSSDSE